MDGQGLWPGLSTDCECGQHNAIKAWVKTERTRAGRNGGGMVEPMGSVFPAAIFGRGSTARRRDGHSRQRGRSDGDVRSMPGMTERSPARSWLPAGEATAVVTKTSRASR